MASRSKKRPDIPNKVPGGRYVANESAGVVREQLEDSMKPENEPWVTILVTSDRVDSLTVCVISLNRTTAACATRDNRVVIIMLGERNEADKSPDLLLDNFDPDAR